MFSSKCFTFRTLVQSIFGIALGFSSASVLANNTPQPLPFFQDWSNPPFVFGWASVPGITGYSGENLNGGVFESNPGNITANDNAPQTSLTLSPFNQNDNTIAGVAQFEGSNPTIALRGDAGADAPYLLITLDTTSVNMGDAWISYILRDMDATRNSVSPVALQYRVGNAGPFTNIPTAYVADATDADATLTTNVLVPLPNAAKGQNSVQLRIITINNNPGEDEWVGVDNILVYAGDLPELDISDANVIEGNATGTPNCVTTPMNFTVSSSVAAPPGGITFAFHTTGGSASAFSDTDFIHVPQGTNAMIEAGETEGTITVEVVCDDKLELQENFIVVLEDDNPGLGQFYDLVIPAGGTVGTGTITPDEILPQLSVDPITTINEGNTVDCVQTPMPFRVSSNIVAPEGGITFQYYTNPIDVNDNDYGQVLVFPEVYSAIPEGYSETFVDIYVNCDDTIEPNEDFTFNLWFNPLYVIANASGNGTIINDDGISLTVEDVSVVEGHTGDTNLTFTIKLSEEAPMGGLSFTVSTDSSPGATNATPGLDYTPLDDFVVSIPGGSEEPVEVSVTIHGDTFLEGNEVFQFIITPDPLTPINEAGSILTATGTIENDDVTQILRITNVSVAEGNLGENPVATFTVSLDQPIPLGYGDVNVKYTTADNTAEIDNNDYLIAGDTLTFMEGAVATSHQFDVAITGDNDVELNETFVVNLSDATGTNVIVADDVGVGTISNDDIPAAPTIIIENINPDHQVYEGDGVLANFMVSLILPVPPPPADTIYNVDVILEDGGSATEGAGGDFIYATETIELSAAQPLVPVYVYAEILDDADAAEGTEAFALGIDNATGGAEIGVPNIASVNILDDDSLATPTFVINSDLPSVNEDDGFAHFTITLLPPGVVGSFDVTVNSLDGIGSNGAQQGSDFTAVVNQTFTLGDATTTTQLISVPITDDSDDEATEYFTLQLSDPTGIAVIGTATANVDIVDNDLPVVDEMFADGFEVP